MKMISQRVDRTREIAMGEVETGNIGGRKNRNKRNGINQTGMAKIQGNKMKTIRKNQNQFRNRFCFETRKRELREGGER
jgi:hypothetical protein